jgi:hypothetical protein
MVYESEFDKKTIEVELKKGIMVRSNFLEKSLKHT